MAKHSLHEDRDRRVSKLAVDHVGDVAAGVEFHDVELAVEGVALALTNCK